jgi:hypothetical protein
MGACSSGTRFLPSPVADDPTDNWSAEDEAAWDKRLAEEGSKEILTAGNAWILDGGCNTQMPRFLVRISYSRFEGI